MQTHAALFFLLCLGFAAAQFTYCCGGGNIDLVGDCTCNAPVVITRDTRFSCSGSTIMAPSLTIHSPMGGVQSDDCDFQITGDMTVTGAGSDRVDVLLFRNSDFSIDGTLFLNGTNTGTENRAGVELNAVTIAATITTIVGDAPNSNGVLFIGTNEVGGVTTITGTSTDRPAVLFNNNGNTAFLGATTITGTSTSGIGVHIRGTFTTQGVTTITGTSTDSTGVYAQGAIALYQDELTVMGTGTRGVWMSAGGSATATFQGATTITAVGSANEGALIVVPVIANQLDIIGSSVAREGVDILSSTFTTQGFTADGTSTNSIGLVLNPQTGSFGGAVTLDGTTSGNNGITVGANGRAYTFSGTISATGTTTGTNNGVSVTGDHVYEGAVTLVGTSGGTGVSMNGSPTFNNAVTVTGTGGTRGVLFQGTNYIFNGPLTVTGTSQTTTQGAVSFTIAAATMEGAVVLTGTADEGFGVGFGKNTAYTFKSTLSITGDSTPTTGAHDGVSIAGTHTFQGDVTITGTTANGGEGVIMSSTNTFVTAADLTVTGTSDFGDGINLQGSFTTADGTTTLTGTANDLATNNDHGIDFNFQSATTFGGPVVMTGTSPTGGIIGTNRALTTFDDTVTLTGTGGTQAGVSLNGEFTYEAALTVTGISEDNIGVLLQGTNVYNGLTTMTGTSTTSMGLRSLGDATFADITWIGTSVEAQGVSFEGDHDFQADADIDGVSDESAGVTGRGTATFQMGADIDGRGMVGVDLSGTLTFVQTPTIDGVGVTQGTILSGANLVAQAGLLVTGSNTEGRAQGINFVPILATVTGPVVFTGTSEEGVAVNFGGRDRSYTFGDTVTISGISDSTTLIDVCGVETRVNTDGVYMRGSHTFSGDVTITGSTLNDGEGVYILGFPTFLMDLTVTGSSDLGDAIAIINGISVTGSTTLVGTTSDAADGGDHGIMMSFNTASSFGGPVSMTGISPSGGIIVSSTGVMTTFGDTVALRGTGGAQDGIDFNGMFTFTSTLDALGVTETAVGVDMQGQIRYEDFANFTATAGRIGVMMDGDQTFVQNVLLTGTADVHGVQITGNSFNVQGTLDIEAENLVSQDNALEFRPAGATITGVATMNGLSAAGFGVGLGNKNSVYTFESTVSIEGETTATEMDGDRDGVNIQGTNTFEGNVVIMGSTQGRGEGVFMTDFPSFQADLSITGTSTTGDGINLSESINVVGTTTLNGTASTAGGASDEGIRIQLSAVSTLQGPVTMVGSGPSSGVDIGSTAALTFKDVVALNGTGGNDDGVRLGGTQMFEAGLDIIGVSQGGIGVELAGTIVYQGVVTIDGTSDNVAVQTSQTHTFQQNVQVVGSGGKEGVDFQGDALIFMGNLQVTAENMDGPSAALLFRPVTAEVTGTTTFNAESGSTNAIDFGDITRSYTFTGAVVMNGESTNPDTNTNSVVLQGNHIFVSSVDIVGSTLGTAAGVRIAGFSEFQSTIDVEGTSRQGDGISLGGGLTVTGAAFFDGTASEVALNGDYGVYADWSSPVTFSDVVTFLGESPFGGISLRARDTSSVDLAGNVILMGTGTSNHGIATSGEWTFRANLVAEGSSVNTDGINMAGDLSFLGVTSLTGTGNSDGVNIRADVTTAGSPLNIDGTGATHGVLLEGNEWMVQGLLDIRASNTAPNAALAFRMLAATFDGPVTLEASATSGTGASIGSRDVQYTFGSVVSIMGDSTATTTGVDGITLVGNMTFEDDVTLVGTSTASGEGVYTSGLFDFQTDLTVTGVSTIGDGIAMNGGLNVKESLFLNGTTLMGDSNSDHGVVFGLNAPSLLDGPTTIIGTSSASGIVFSSKDSLVFGDSTTLTGTGSLRNGIDLSGNYTFELDVVITGSSDVTAGLVLSGESLFQGMTTLDGTSTSGLGTYLVSGSYTFEQETVIRGVGDTRGVLITGDDFSADDVLNVQGSSGLGQNGAGLDFRPDTATLAGVTTFVGSSERGSGVIVGQNDQVFVFQSDLSVDGEAQSANPNFSGVVLRGNITVQGAAEILGTTNSNDNGIYVEGSMSFGTLAMNGTSVAGDGIRLRGGMEVIGDTVIDGETTDGNAGDYGVQITFTLPSAYQGTVNFTGVSNGGGGVYVSSVEPLEFVGEVTFDGTGSAAPGIYLIGDQTFQSDFEATGRAQRGDGIQFVDAVVSFAGTVVMDGTSTSDEGVSLTRTVADFAMGATIDGQSAEGPDLFDNGIFFIGSTLTTGGQLLITGNATRRGVRITDTVLDLTNGQAVIEGSSEVFGILVQSVETIMGSAPIIMRATAGKYGVQLFSSSFDNLEVQSTVEGGSVGLLDLLGVLLSDTTGEMVISNSTLDTTVTYTGNFANYTTTAFVASSVLIADSSLDGTATSPFLARGFVHGNDQPLNIVDSEVTVLATGSNGTFGLTGQLAAVDTTITADANCQDDIECTGAFLESSSFTDSTLSSTVEQCNSACGGVYLLDSFESLGSSSVTGQVGVDDDLLTRDVRDFGSCGSGDCVGIISNGTVLTGDSLELIGLGDVGISLRNISGLLTEGLRLEGTGSEGEGVSFTTASESAFSTPLLDILGSSLSGDEDVFLESAALNLLVCTERADCGLRVASGAEGSGRSTLDGDFELALRRSSCAVRFATDLTATGLFEVSDGTEFSAQALDVAGVLRLEGLDAVRISGDVDAQQVLVEAGVLDYDDNLTSRSSLTLDVKDLTLCGLLEAATELKISEAAICGSRLTLRADTVILAQLDGSGTVVTDADLTEITGSIGARTAPETISFTSVVNLGGSITVQDDLDFTSGRLKVVGDAVLRASDITLQDVRLEDQRSLALQGSSSCDRRCSIREGAGSSLLLDGGSHLVRGDVRATVLLRDATLRGDGSISRLRVLDDDTTLAPLPTSSSDAGLQIGVLDLSGMSTTLQGTISTSATSRLSVDTATRGTILVDVDAQGSLPRGREYEILSVDSGVGRLVLQNASGRSLARDGNYRTSSAGQLLESTHTVESYENRLVIGVGIAGAAPAPPLPTETPSVSSSPSASASTSVTPQASASSQPSVTSQASASSRPSASPTQTRALPIGPSPGGPVEVPRPLASRTPSRTRQPAIDFPSPLPGQTNIISFDFDSESSAWAMTLSITLILVAFAAAI